MVLDWTGLDTISIVWYWLGLDGIIVRYWIGLDSKNIAKYSEAD